MGAAGIPASCELRCVGTPVLMALKVRTGWGVDPAEPDENPRRCPRCATPILPGRALCHPCYVRAEQQRRAFTERAWMTRNYPNYRPRSLFPEDYDQEEVTR